MNAVVTKLTSNKVKIDFTVEPEQFEPARPLPVIEPPTASAPLSVEEVLRERQDDAPAAQTDEKSETASEIPAEEPLSNEPDTPAEDESKKESSENE